MRSDALSRKRSGASVCSFFEGSEGSVGVLHAVISPSTAVTASAQVGELAAGYSELCGLYPGFRPVFARFFLSDAANQAVLVGDLAESLGCPVSIVEQAPLCPSKMNLLVMMESGRKEPSRHIYYTAGAVRRADSHEATVEILDHYAAGHDLVGECVRTWFFVNDIDNNYAGMVSGRNDVFGRYGLTPDSHFIASTGIAGRGVDPGCPVCFDAYAIRGITSGQVTYLKALTHLNPTIEYGVAFERATAVDFADRRLVLVSGTASIDNRGEIVHHGDVTGQTRRMVENVEALLAEAGCSAADLMHMIVYLRDPGDYLTVGAELDRLFPSDVPRVIVHAPVCRPGWLVEMECMAMRMVDNGQFAEY